MASIVIVQRTRTSLERNLQSIACHISHVKPRNSSTLYTIAFERLIGFTYCRLERSVQVKLSKAPELPMSTVTVIWQAPQRIAGIIIGKIMSEFGPVEAVHMSRRNQHSAQVGLREASVRSFNTVPAYHPRDKVDALLMYPLRVDTINIIFIWYIN